MTRILVVCNTYPSDDNLYRNGFIHRRVVGYRDAGIDVTIYRVDPGAEEPSSYEFEGIPVHLGTRTSFETFLARHDLFDAHLVHFVNPDMVEPLLLRGPRVPMFIWIHGFEAEAWHRRWFNFVSTASAIRNGVARRDGYFRQQNAFLRSLFTDSPENVSFVHVSDWFRVHIVEPDVGAPTPRFHVIPNLIDEEFFPYRPKSAEDRLRLLSIRPYASRKYANDTTIAAILELSKRPWFPQLRISLHGEGHLFAELTKRVARLRNVSVKQGFLTQTEIAALHAQHGVFLSPTRFDSQGVSMGEAASSGLVVLSTGIASVPEFFDHGRNALLGRPENVGDLVAHVEGLYYSPDYYLQLSEAGAAHMTAVAGRRATIDREIDLILGAAGQARRIEGVDWRSAYGELERTVGDMLLAAAHQLEQANTLQLVDLTLEPGSDDEVTAVVTTTHNALLRFEVRTEETTVASRPEAVQNSFTFPRPSGPWTVQVWARRSDSKRIITMSRSEK